MELGSSFLSSRRTRDKEESSCLEFYYPCPNQRRFRLAPPGEGKKASPEHVSFRSRGREKRALSMGPFRLSSTLVAGKGGGGKSRVNPARLTISSNSVHFPGREGGKKEKEKSRGSVEKCV